MKRKIDKEPERRVARRDSDSSAHTLQNDEVKDGNVLSTEIKMGTAAGGSAAERSVVHREAGSPNTANRLIGPPAPASKYQSAIVEGEQEE